MDRKTNKSLISQTIYINNYCLKPMEMKKTNIILIFIIILLLGYLGIRLVNQSQIIHSFPLDITNDISSYMAQLHFLDEFGYHQTVTKWFAPEGFVLFEIEAPAWHFFTYPFYLLFKDVKPASFFSLVIMFVLMGLLIFIIAKKEGLNKLEALAFFALFAVSPMGVGDYIRQMKLPQMFAWIILLILILIIFYFKKNQINWKFLITAPLISILILSHQPETILFLVLLAGLFLIKDSLKERIIIAVSALIGILVSLPWLIPFITKAQELRILSYQASKWLLEFSGGFRLANITLILLSLGLIVIFILYLKKTNKWKKELLFFSPILILNILVLTRLVIVLPILKHLYIDPYMQFFSFFFILILFKTYKKYNFLKYMVALLPIIFVIVSLIHTPWFIQPTPEETESLKIFEHVDGIYGFAGSFSKQLYPRALDSYAAIYYPLRSASGWSLSDTEEHDLKLKEFNKALINNDKTSFLRLMKDLKIDEVISYGEDCQKLEAFNLNLKAKEGHLCLYEYKKENL